PVAGDLLLDGHERRRLDGPRGVVDLDLHQAQTLERPREPIHQEVQPAVRVDGPPFADGPALRVGLLEVRVVLAQGDRPLDLDGAAGAEVLLRRVCVGAVAVEAAFADARLVAAAGQVRLFDLEPLAGLRQLDPGADQILAFVPPRAGDAHAGTDRRD